MVRCLEDHRTSLTGDAEFIVAINVAASGAATSVQLTPDAVDKTPLGGCLRNVLMKANFPSSPAAQVLRIPLKPKT
jgi:hypothetical protein